MSRSPEQDTELAAREEWLASQARQELGQLSDAQRSVGWRQLNRRLDSRAKPTNLTPRAAVVVAALVAMVAFAVGRFVPSLGERPLTYQVDGVVHADGAGITTGARPRQLRFSDGTDVTIQANSEARVRSVTQAGAHVVVERGAIRVQVTHGPDARWFFDAGPFVIRVTGTQFVVNWQRGRSELRVLLEHGSVEVTGPLSDAPIRLRAGQELVARVDERQFVIRDVSAQSSPQPTQVEAEPQPAPKAEPVPSVARSPSPPDVPSAPVWTARVAAGAFKAVVEDAERLGIDSVLGTASSADLAALADAARFSRRGSLAARALTAQRKRFPSSSRAKDAAFLLGRLREAASDHAGALLWYDRYLVEAPSGTYSSEVLGRKMLVVQRLFGDAKARAIASDYLRRFPAGTYAKTARRLVGAH